MAFFHDDNLGFDGEGEFMRAHGFVIVCAAESSPTSPLDATLLPERSIGFGRSRRGPSFLMRWTDDTHHPYSAPTRTDYGVQDQSLNRYLNAVHESDPLVGALADQLQAMGWPTTR